MSGNPENEVYVPSEAFSIRSHVKSLTEYKSMWARSVENPDQFWADVARKYIDFFVPFTQVHRGDLVHGDVAWFLNGKLNACYNCVDRHLETKADQVAILWEGDQPGVVRKVTYLELYYQVCKLANALKKLGIRKGDVVCVYMPMVPEAVVAMLACARIGAIHTSVFEIFLENEKSECFLTVLFSQDLVLILFEIVSMTDKRL
jgi:acetyl-CoA synthetase